MLSELLSYDLEWLIGQIWLVIVHGYSVVAFYGTPTPAQEQPPQEHPVLQELRAKQQAAGA